MLGSVSALGLKSFGGALLSQYTCEIRDAGISQWLHVE